MTCFEVAYLADHSDREQRAPHLVTAQFIEFPLIHEEVKGLLAGDIPGSIPTRVSEKTWRNFQ